MRSKFCVMATAFLVLLSIQAQAAALDVKQTEKRYGFRIQTDKEIIEFEEGDSATAEVMDPEKLSERLGFPETEKGDTFTMTYEGGNTFTFSGHSGGKALTGRVAVATIVIA